MKGDKKRTLCAKDILELVDEYSIYRLYLPDFNKPGEIFLNTLRGEKNPSMMVKWSGVHLKHSDFGRDEYRGGCFDLVMQAFHCNYDEALQIVDRDFNLGIVEKKRNIPSVIKWTSPEEIEIKYPPVIKVIPRPANKLELDYWGKLCQGESELKRENVFFPKSIFRNGKRLPQVKDLLTFCYYYPELDKWKLYRPFAEKNNKNLPPQYWKWDSNVPNDYVDKLETIIGPGNNFVAKGRKDKLLLQCILETDKIIVVQAENKFAMSQKALDTLKHNSSTYGGVNYAVTDNDNTGKQFSWWLTTEHNYKHINAPDKYLMENPKKTDFPDIAYYYDVSVVKDYFKLKNITNGL